MNSQQENESIIMKRPGVHKSGEKRYDDEGIQEGHDDDCGRFKVLPCGERNEEP
jgi:hypothetical protein